MLSDYSRWANGMALLSEAVGTGTMPHKKIDTMFGNLYNYFSRVLYARAIGRRLTEAAAAQGVLGEVGRALTIAQIDDGKPQKVSPSVAKRNVSGRGTGRSACPPLTPTAVPKSS